MLQLRYSCYGKSQVPASLAMAVCSASNQCWRINVTITSSGISQKTDSYLFLSCLIYSSETGLGMDRFSSHRLGLIHIMPYPYPNRARKDLRNMRPHVGTNAAKLQRPGARSMISMPCFEFCHLAIRSLWGGSQFGLANRTNRNIITQQTHHLCLALGAVPTQICKASQGRETAPVLQRPVGNKLLSNCS